jgi:hypothetical protein
MAKERITPKTAYVNATCAAPNAGDSPPMSFTLRENQTVFTLIAVWGLVTALATVTGPFGTLENMSHLGRFGYWAGVVAVSVGGSHLASGQKAARGYLAWTAFVICITSLVYALNFMLFEGWQGWTRYLYLLGIVTVIVLIVHGAIALIHAVRPDSVLPVDPSAPFLARIPLPMRGALIRIEAQDHYLNIVTDKGSSLILLRLGEAVRELAQAPGIQVHRSHWVALSGVTSHRRTEGRDLLVMTDRSEVPVSRSFRTAAQAAGLF